MAGIQQDWSYWMNDTMESLLTYDILLLGINGKVIIPKLWVSLKYSSLLSSIFSSVSIIFYSGEFFIFLIPRIRSSLVFFSPCMIQRDTWKMLIYCINWQLGWIEKRTKLTKKKRVKEQCQWLRECFRAAEVAAIKFLSDNRAGSYHYEIACKRQ